MSILKKGLKGAPVKRLQEKLGVTADGDFGPGTEKALKEFQKTKGLAVDGIAGPDTFAAIGLPELILLRRGVKGAQVKKLQEALGISADGSFGPGTEKAVMEFQAKNGLTADGMAGPETLAKVGSFDIITAATVAAAAVKPDEAHFEAAPLPELKDNTVVAPAKPAADPVKTADAAKAAMDSAAQIEASVKAMTAAAKPVEAPKTASVWGKMTGWF